ncbi:MAG TPA: histidinol dehydrogenase, partial [Lactobacillus sp.]|nr:histidinol dehydrogenase [Lactobacillus sp.]
MKILKNQTLDQLLEQVDRQTDQQANQPEVEATVSEIIANVIKNGDKALKEYSQKFDKVELDDLRVPQADIDAAYKNADQDLIDALNLAKNNIVSYHQKEIQNGFVDAEQKGVVRGE